MYKDYLTDGSADGKLDRADAALTVGSTVESTAGSCKHNS